MRAIYYSMLFDVDWFDQCLDKDDYCLLNRINSYDELIKSRVNTQFIAEVTTHGYGAHMLSKT